MPEEFLIGKKYDSESQCFIYLYYAGIIVYKLKVYML